MLEPMTDVAPLHPLLDPDFWQLPLSDRMARFADLREEGPFRLAPAQTPRLTRPRPLGFPARRLRLPRPRRKTPPCPCPKPGMPCMAMICRP